MATKISKTSLTGLLGGLLVALSLTGCASLIYSVLPTKTKSFTITGVEYDEAFSKAMRAAMESGFAIFTSDKSGGSFYAFRGMGLVEMTDITFLLEKGTQGRLSFIVRVESSKGSEGVIDEFLAAYGKYVKISP